MVLGGSLALVMATPCLAAEPFCRTGKPHPIEVRLDRAVEKAEGMTYAVRKAQGEAYAAWDKELNRTYQELMAVLKGEDQEQLRRAQRAWLAYRDAQIELWWAPGIYGGGGNQAPVEVGDLSRALLIQRVCDLLWLRQVAEFGGT